MLLVAGRDVENLLSSSQRKGSAVPVAASVSKKKNNQRGPTVGSDVVINKTRPNQPLRANTPAEIIKLR
jgi:hypothetical protein